MDQKLGFWVDGDWIWGRSKSSLTKARLLKVVVLQSRAGMILHKIVDDGAAARLEFVLASPSMERLVVVMVFRSLMVVENRRLPVSSTA